MTQTQEVKKCWEKYREDKISLRKEYQTKTKELETLTRTKIQEIWGK